ncbi:MAG TPA: SRPBCC domain-containing protein [Terriglobales bacterium]|nr:SRPBCC domain-containing protein [Terriglobales bacterium]
MPQTIATPDLDSLVTEIHIAAPPERVFQAISSEQEQRIWWDKKDGNLKNWDMDARRGGKWQFSTNKTTMNINGVTKFECSGEIVEFDPPRVLAYTWIANWHNDKSRKTLVRWELTPKDGGTLVKVTHSGLAQEDVARNDYQNGWPGVVERLKSYIEK